MINKRRLFRLGALVLAMILLLMTVSGCETAVVQKVDSTFRLLASVENQDLESLLQAHASEQGVRLEVTYKTTMDMMAALNDQNCPYDGVWLSNSIWLYLLNGKNKITDSKIISINPIVFGIAQSKARALGFIGRDVYMNDLVSAVKAGSLSFIMPSATQTNSGASAYLGFLGALSGNPEVLTLAHLRQPQLKDDLIGLFSGVARNSGSEAYLEELYQSGNYDAMVNYEFMIIDLNKRRVDAGQEPLQLIYPKDGVSMSDSPFAYIDHGDDAKKAAFLALQGYLLSEDAQREMAKTGRRTGYGGLNPYGDTASFNPDWGIDMGSYLSPVKYPSADVIRQAFALYQEELKKPAVTVFCLDMSGSMSGKGHKELMAAMTHILTPESASEDFIQFGNRDQIVLIPFDSMPQNAIIGTGDEQASLLRSLDRLLPGGGTDVYAALRAAYQTAKRYSDQDYTISFVLMTDGQSQGDISTFTNEQSQSSQDIGVYSITFGDADTRQLNTIAKLTGGRVFDGKSDLLNAFRTVRGYS